MDFMKMKYKGFDFNINPNTFKISAKKEICEKIMPYNNSSTQEIGEASARISGTGVFVGADAMDKAYQLMNLFNKKGSDYLFLPSGDLYKMFFANLDIKYSSSSDKVEYAFSFIEDKGDKKHEYEFGYTYVKENENLFDVSSRTGVKLEQLVEINELQSIYGIAQGEKLWLM